MTNKLIPPVIKWTGSKRLVASKLSTLFPNSQNFFDPFVGGGSMLPFYNNQNTTAGDIIPELINLWNLIKYEPEFVARTYKSNWEKLQKVGYMIYYEIREHFNKTKDPTDLLFLSRTCVNGLIRYNKNGEFNNSFHHSRPGINPEKFKIIIYKWSTWIKNTTFVNQDYLVTLSKAKKGDLVFLDPPYIGTHSSYIPQKFSYEIFYNELDRLNKGNINWILTFDGTAGNRSYGEKIPSSLYKSYFTIETGKSPFSKVMGNKQDIINESVYLNFKPSVSNF